MIEIFTIIICLIFNAILAGSETAFISVSRSSLKELAKKGDESAELLLRLRENPERILSVIQIGITFVGVLAAALGGAGAEEIIAPWLISRFNIREGFAEVIAVLFVVIPLTYISVVIGELVPKTFALRRPMFLASKAAPWLHFVSRIIDPIVSAFEWSTKKIINFFPKSQALQEEVSESEINSELGVLSPKNKQYVINILKIETTTVNKIMIEWDDVAYVESKEAMEQVENLIISSGHTRLPVVKDNQVIGIINTKEFLALQKTGSTEWLSILRPALKIANSTFILTALQIMQQKRAHMAIVYKRATKVGIITMESIFEEIIGDIYDEDDDGILKAHLNQLRRLNEWGD